MRIGGGAVSIADVTDRTARDLGFVRPFWLNEIRNGRAISRGERLNASVGDNGHIQLFNPAGSGITIIVHQIIYAPIAIDLCYLRAFNTELTTLRGTGFNLRAGSAAASGVLRIQDNAGLLGTGRDEFQFLARVSRFVVDGWDIELGEGEGVLMVGNNTNQDSYCTYRWIEV